MNSDCVIQNSKLPSQNQWEQTLSCSVIIECIILLQNKLDHNGTVKSESHSITTDSLIIQDLVYRLSYTTVNIYLFEKGPSGN